MDDTTAKPNEAPVQEENIETPPVQEETPEVDEKEALDNSKNPERTKEYIDKVKKERDEYKELFESLRPNEVPEQAQTYQDPINQAPDASNFSNLNQTQIDDAFKSMMDADGYLDGNKLMGLLRDLEQKTISAEERAKKLEQEREQEKKEAFLQEEQKAQTDVYSKYPSLNPNNTEEFNPRFYNYVRKELESLARSGVKPSGEDYMKAADQVYVDFYEGREDMTKKEKEQQEKTEDAKRQINANRPRSSTQPGYWASEEDEALRASIRAGKKGSVAEYLRRKGL